MRLGVLMENSTPSSRFAARHGLSLWLEIATSDGLRRVLFDFGPDGTSLDNAHELGIVVGRADFAVLSHGHYDHGGGLGAYLAMPDATAPVLVRTEAFRPHASGTPSSHHLNGINPAWARHPRVTCVPAEAHVIELADGLALFTTQTRPHPTPVSNRRLLMQRDDGSWVPDDFSHEQSLLVCERGRWILVAGCAHAGILNIMDEAGRIAGAPLDVVVAGFHLMNPSAGTAEDAEAVRALAHALAVRPVRYHTCHCTGVTPFGVLREVLGERMDYLSAGTCVEV